MPIGQPFIQLTEVASTNNYATGQAQAHLAEHGTAWFAHSQTAGKGQRGKKWFSQPGENIIMSCLINPHPLRADEQFFLSAALALACHELVSKYAGDLVKIKWPNDIYWRDRKAGGILIENHFRGKQWLFAVAGMGININQVHFTPALINPVSLQQVTKQHYNAVTLARELCTLLEQRWQQVVAGKKEHLIADYNKQLYKRNERVKFKNSNEEFEAMVKGVDSNGVLQLDNKTRTTLVYGKAEWIIETE